MLLVQVHVHMCTNLVGINYRYYMYEGLLVSCIHVYPTILHHAFYYFMQLCPGQRLPEILKSVQL